MSAIVKRKARFRHPGKANIKCYGGDGIPIRDIIEERATIELMKELSLSLSHPKGKQVEKMFKKCEESPLFVFANVPASRSSHFHHLSILQRSCDSPK